MTDRLPSLRDGGNFVLLRVEVDDAVSYQLYEERTRRAAGSRFLTLVAMGDYSWAAVLADRLSIDPGDVRID